MTKRPEKTAVTKADIEEAFWRIYATTPIEKITVGQVCELAGYNRATFYLHYHDIYELLDTIEQRLLVGMTDCVEKCMKNLSDDDSKPARIRALADVIMFYEHNKSYIVVLLGEEGDPSFVIRLKDNLKPLWREHVVGNKAGRTEQEIDLYLEFMISGTLFMVGQWLKAPGDISAAQMGRLVYDASIREDKERVG